MAEKNLNTQYPGQEESPSGSHPAKPIFGDFDDYPDFGLFADDMDEMADNITFFDRQFLLIDGNDETIDLILTDDTNSPTLGQMLANGAEGENFYAILDANGEHIPMVRDVEMLITATSQENASEIQKIMGWEDLKSHGIEINSDSNAITLTGWHLADNPGYANLPRDAAINQLTTTWENGRGLRLETTLRNMDSGFQPAGPAENQGNEINSLMPLSPGESDDLQTVLFLAQDGNC